MRIMNGLGWVEILAQNAWIVLDIDNLESLRKTVNAHRTTVTTKQELKSLCSQFGQGPAVSEEDAAERVLAGLSTGDVCVDAAHWFACAFQTFHSVHAARLFVQSVMREPGVPAFLRGLVARHHFTFKPLSDEAVVEQVAAMIFQGALRVRTGRFIWNSCVPDPKPEPAPPPRPSAPPPRAAPPPEPETPSSFGPFADFDGLAAVMREAAQLGVPFCEECQKRQQQH